MPLYAISETLFHNATIYFAVISGLLFSLVLNKHSWGKFYLNKFKNVLAPYIVFSILYAFINGMLFVEPNSTPLTFGEIIYSLPMHIVTGSSFAHMWYIPVLVAMFLLTPLFNLIVTNKALTPIMVLIISAPLVVSRSWPDFVWENFVFFWGPYILGMFIGNYYKQAQLIFNKFKALLWFIVVISTGTLVYLYLVEFEAIQGVKIQESIGYIQKLAIAFLVIDVMQRNEKALPTFLYKLGDCSFSIYFIHMFFAAVFGFVMVTTGFTPPTLLGIFVSGFVLFFLTILVSVGFSLLTRKISGRYSRYIIGS